MRLSLVAAAAAALLAGCANHAAHSQVATAPESPAHGHSAAPVVQTLEAGKGEQIVTVGVPEDFTPVAPAGATDEYRCFVVDPGLDSDVMITGTEFVPDNAAIVHHSILYAATAQQVAAAEAMDAADAQPGYECFGGSMLPRQGDDFGLDQSDWLTAWAPGGKTSELPAGYGMPLEKDGRIVIQMHYNLRTDQGSDSTKVRLRVTPEDRKPMSTMLLPAPVELPCAPGESGRLCDRDDAVDDVISRFGMDSGRTIAGLQLLCGGDPANPKAGAEQTCDRPVTRDTKVFAVAGHMHLLGREISVTLNPGEPGEKVLLDIDNWDFDQQGAIPLDKPVNIGPGDTLRVRCKHDAGLRSQLPTLQGTPAKYVVWGEGTTDEMCLAIVLNG